MSTGDSALPEGLAKYRTAITGVLSQVQNRVGGEPVTVEELPTVVGDLIRRLEKAEKDRDMEGATALRLIGIVRDVRAALTGDHAACIHEDILPERIRLLVRSNNDKTQVLSEISRLLPGSGSVAWPVLPAVLKPIIEKGIGDGAPPPPEDVSGQSREQAEVLEEFADILRERAAQALEEFTDTLRERSAEVFTLMAEAFDGGKS